MIIMNKIHTKKAFILLKTYFLLYTPLYNNLLSIYLLL